MLTNETLQVLQNNFNN